MNFKLQLLVAYYNHGYFNVPVRFSDFLGPDSSPVTINCCGMLIEGHIDRKATRTGAPRIKGYKELRDQIQSNFNFGDIAEYTIIGPNEIRITQTTSRQ